MTGHKPLSEKKEVIDLSVSYGKDRKSLVPELKQRWDDIRHHRETCSRRTVERTFESCSKDKGALEGVADGVYGTSIMREF